MYDENAEHFAYAVKRAEAHAALPERVTEDKENWGSVAEDWRLDAPGGWG